MSFILQPTFNKKSFTPSLISSGGGAPVYGTAAGILDLIGNRAFLDVRIILSSLGTLAAGTLTMSGLPTFPVSVSMQRAVLSISCAALAASAATDLNAWLTYTGSTVIFLAKFSGGVNSQLTLSDISGTADFSLSGNYRIF